MHSRRLALFSAFVLSTASVTTFAATPAGQTNQGTQTAAAANQPCTPSTTASILSGARSLLKIGTSLMETKNSLSDATYSERAQTANTSRKGNDVLDNVESLGVGGKPCG